MTQDLGACLGPAQSIGNGERIRRAAPLEEPLAELTDDTPPGPPNSVSTVGFSWDSSTLPEGIKAGDPLALEIMPNQASGEAPGYLDVDNVRVSVVWK